LIKKLILSIIFALLSQPLLHTSDKYFGDDTYSIDNSKVMLYKLINWWNIYGGEESQRLCNRSLHYEDTRKVALKYQANLKILELHLDNDFASLISIMGTANFKSTYLGTNYFDSMRTQSISNSDLDTKIITFKNMNKKQYEELQKIQNDLVILVEGKISGLLEDSGKIALHSSGKFFRQCFYNNEVKNTDYPLTLKIFDNKSKKLIAEYQS